MNVFKAASGLGKNLMKKKINSHLFVIVVDSVYLCRRIEKDALDRKEGSKNDF